MITSKTNQQVKNVVLLQKKAKERKSQNVFLVEGERMVLEAPLDRVKNIYISEDLYNEKCNGDNTRIEQFIKKCEEAGILVEEVANDVYKAMTDTVTPQGIMAIITRAESCILEDSDAYLLLEEIQDPGNLGTLFRTAEAAGIKQVIMSPGCVDIYNPKCVRSTMGTLYRMPFYKCKNDDEWYAAISKLQDEGVNIFGAALGASQSYSQVDYTSKCGFIIGNEGNGLREETINKSISVIIPMEGAIESLNAAMAGGILMYEMSRQRRL